MENNTEIQVSLNKRELLIISSAIDKYLRLETIKHSARPEIETISDKIFNLYLQIA